MTQRQQRHVGVVGEAGSTDLVAALTRAGYRASRVGDGVEDQGFDVLFVAGPLDDAQLLERLEHAGMPHTCSAAASVRHALDRGAAKALFRKHNLATATGYVVTLAELSSLDARQQDLGFPSVVKPSKGRGAPGVVVQSLEALRAAVVQACSSGGEALVERYVKGRAVTVCLLGEQVLGSAEVSGTRVSLPRLSSTRIANLEALARLAANALGCRGAARVDFLCPDIGNEVVLELNPVPELSTGAVFTKVASRHGLSFEALCERVVQLAHVDAPAEVLETRHVG
jgi:D-alanine-D-alanine ligase